MTDDWFLWYVEQRDIFPRYRMAAKTLHDLHRSRCVLEIDPSVEDPKYPRDTPEPVGTLSEQPIVWAMAVIKFHREGPPNRDGEISEVDQLADEYAQRILSLLVHRNAEVEREVQAANKMLNELEPSLSCIHENIGLDHNQCLRMSTGERARHHPDRPSEYLDNLHNTTVECCRKRADQILEKSSGLEVESKRLKEAEH